MCKELITYSSMCLKLLVADLSAKYENLQYCNFTFLYLKIVYIAYEVEHTVQVGDKLLIFLF